MNMSSIGKNIRKYRNAKKISRDKLAELVDVSLNYLGQIERGEKLPSFETFITIANALEVSADMLLCDVVKASFPVKDTILHDKISKLSDKDRARIYDIIDTEIKHSVQVKP